MDSPDSSSGSLVGGIVGAIISILIVAVVLVLWYMMERRDREGEKYGEHKRQNNNIIEGRKIYLLIYLCSLKYARSLKHVQLYNSCKQLYDSFHCTV